MSSTKTVFWKNKDTLLLSDLHLGKGNIGNTEEYILQQKQKIDKALSEHSQQRIIILGDLFDAKSKVDPYQFKETFVKYKNILLVLGNHDILNPKIYFDIGINSVTESFEEDMFVFTHKPLLSDKLNIHGHLHPGLSKDKPCFILNDSKFGLPAFGGKTGKSIIKMNGKYKMFVIEDDNVSSY